MNFILAILLFPVSLIYGLVTYIRNKLFDFGVFHSKHFDVPVVSVGNLSLGGTGKTPMVEFLVKKLKTPDNRIATVSRGYGRQTKGFVLATKNSNHKDIGDEPVQYIQKFENVTVVVDEKRVHGVKKLCKQKEKPDIVILDDAYQHRWIKPGLNILLTDFYHLYTRDYVFPVGRLREFRRGAKRADMIVVTKCPKVLSPIEIETISKKVRAKSSQNVFFSSVEYAQKWKCLANSEKIKPVKTNTIILFVGISNPYPYQEYLHHYCKEVVTIKFKDHHQYKPKDIDKILHAYNSALTSNKIIVTTEKDVMRIINTDIIHTFGEIPVYYVPIKVKFHEGFKQTFLNEVYGYIEENKREH